jgi:ribonuclease HI
MGIGVVVLHGKQRIERGEYLGDGTNNIAELTAIERGLDLVAEAFPSTQPPLRIYTDSQYSIGVLGLGWKAKANQELVARLRQRLGTVGRVEFVKVAGHAGVPENERCDELAREGIRQARR